MPKKPRGPSGGGAEIDKHTAMDLFEEFQIGLGKAVLAGWKDHLEALLMLGDALTRHGRHQEALKVDQRIAELRPEDPSAHYNLACSYSNLKDADQAIAALEKALRLGYRDISHLLRDEDLLHVRRDPRFRKLIERKWGKRRSR